MTYVGDFPPCPHEFTNSSGIILCKWCGVISRANTPSSFGTGTVPRG